MTSRESPRIMASMIGNRIRLRRAVLRRSQAWLADEVGVSVNTIGTWERGETSPRIHDLPALATALQTTDVWLVAGDVGDADGREVG